LKFLGLWKNFVYLFGEENFMFVELDRYVYLEAWREVKYLAALFENWWNDI
jgi:hypothetical protein